MELIERKQINNLPHYNTGDPGFLKTGRTVVINGRLPGQVDYNNKNNNNNSSNNNTWWNKNGSGIIGAGTGAVNLAANLYQSAQPATSTADIMSTAGLTTQYHNGVAYQQYQNLDTSGIESQAKLNTTTSALGGLAAGAAAGAALGPWGAAAGAVIGGVGGLIAGKSAERKQKRQIELARREIQSQNDYFAQEARLKAIELKYAEDYGDLDSQSLYHASAGKPSDEVVNGETVGKFFVNTSDGVTKDNQNSWVSKNEVIQNLFSGNMYKVKNGPNDTARANLKFGDIVWPTKLKNPDTGRSFAIDAPMYAMLGMTPRLQNNLKDVKDMNVISRRNNGKLGHYAAGGEFWYNTLPAVTNLWLAGRKYNEASQDTYKPMTYVPNRLADKALLTMGEQRINEYPIINDQYRAGRNAMNAIAKSGGLSSGQRLLGYTNIANDTQRNAAQVRANAQLQNAQLNQQYADAMLKSGEADRSAMMNALWNDNKLWIEAENARKAGRFSSMYDLSNALTQWASNEFDRRRFNRTMSLYEKEQADKDEENKKRAKGLNKPKLSYIPSSNMQEDIKNLEKLISSVVDNWLQKYNKKRVPFYKRFINKFAS